LNQFPLALFNSRSWEEICDLESPLDGPLALAAEIRAAQLGYESVDDYLMALALQDIMNGDDRMHEFTAQISSLSPAEQERIDRQLLQHVRRGES